MVNIINGDNLNKEERHKIENIIKILESFRTQDNMRISSYSLDSGEIKLEHASRKDNILTKSDTLSDTLVEIESNSLSKSKKSKKSSKSSKSSESSESSESSCESKRISETSELESAIEDLLKSKHMKGGQVDVGEVDTIFSITEIKNKYNNNRNKLSSNLFKMKGGKNTTELKDKMQALGITSDSTDSICE